MIDVVGGGSQGVDEGPKATVGWGGTPVVVGTLGEGTIFVDVGRTSVGVGVGFGLSLGAGIPSVIVVDVGGTSVGVVVGVGLGSSLGAGTPFVGGTLLGPESLTVDEGNSASETGVSVQRRII